MFVVPANAVHSHTNTGETEAILFDVTDSGLLENMGILEFKEKSDYFSQTSLYTFRSFSSLHFEISWKVLPFMKEYSFICCIAFVTPV